MGKALIKKIRTPSHYYVYDTWTNEILEVDRAVFHLLPDDFPGTNGEEAPGELELRRASEAICQARTAGYFREESPTISSFPESVLGDSLKELMAKGPDHLILNTTERCNLRCRYCAFSGAYAYNRVHSERVMSEEVIQQAIDWYFGHQREDYSIGFYGGEPLLDFPSMEKAVRHATGTGGKSLRFRLTTNGTLLSARICRFLIENDFRVTVSIDGPSPVHDRYRVYPSGRGSFGKTWEGLLRLRSMAPDYFARRVSYNVVAASPVELLQIHEFMEEHGQVFHDHPVTISRVNPYPSCLPEDLADLGDDGNLPAQKTEMYRAFREKVLSGSVYPENFPFAFFKSDFMDFHQRVMSPMRDVVPSNGQCVPGDPKCFVATDGTLYMCERVGESRPIGSVWKGLDGEAIVAILRAYDTFFRDECSGCWALRLCHKCFINVRQEDAFSKQRMEEFCRSNLRRWHWVLEKYCEIRELKQDAFAWCKDSV